jgi:hypothetical protein
VPADQDREWWIVSRDRPRGERRTAVVIIEGDELRRLLHVAGVM